MSERTLPTENPDALMNFVEGRNALNVYFGTGRAADLEDAKTRFVNAEQFDPAFALATFYAALTDNELRDADAAIARLERLTQRRVDFLPQAYLQLAYAHTKKYQDEHFTKADEALNQAHDAARRANRSLIPLIESYRVFLYSVMGGHLHDEPRRESYLGKAISLGERLLDKRSMAKLPERRQILFELHNALGIAYMRKGETQAAFSSEQSGYWKQARDHYRLALENNPSAARTLQNQGTLLLLEGDQAYLADRTNEPGRAYLAALELYLTSFHLNPHDQFVHFRLAGLYARLNDWERAKEFRDSGLTENGSVSRVDWDRLDEAIEHKDATYLIHAARA